MDKPQNRFISVVYQLYTITDGQKNLEEQTSEERPFELITGFGIALDRFEEEVLREYTNWDVRSSRSTGISTTTISSRAQSSP